MSEEISIKLYTEATQDQFTIDSDKKEWFNNMWTEGSRITISNNTGLIAGYDLSKYKAFEIVKEVKE